MIKKFSALILTAIRSFYSKNKLVIYILSAGVLVKNIAEFAQYYYGYVIPPVVTLLNYTALFLFLSALFAYMIRVKQNILSSVFLLGIMLLIVEIVCFFLLGMPDKENKDFSLIEFDSSHIASHLGSVPFSDSVHHSIQLYKSDTVFDVHFTTDKDCKRITPDYSSERKKHALFFGCSIGFGLGVEDNETLPYYFQQVSEEYNAYNYGYTGYGTNHMLARLQFQDLSQQIPEKEGIAVYVFFWDHIYRAIGAMSRYTKWGHDAPYYTMSGGELVRKGNFKDGRPFISWFYENFYQTSIANYFQLDFPNKLYDRHYDLMCEMIQKSKDTYKQQFGSDNFYVLIYPTYGAEDDWDFGKFKACLKKKKIKYIDLFDFIDYGPKYHLLEDGHPNAGTNELIGEELLRRIKQIN